MVCCTVYWYMFCCAVWCCVFMIVGGVHGNQIGIVSIFIFLSKWLLVCSLQVSTPAIPLLMHSHYYKANLFLLSCFLDCDFIYSTLVVLFSFDQCFCISVWYTPRHLQLMWILAHWLLCILSNLDYICESPFSLYFRYKWSTAIFTHDTVDFTNWVWPINNHSVSCCILLFDVQYWIKWRSTKFWVFFFSSVVASHFV